MHLISFRDFISISTALHRGTEVSSMDPPPPAGPACGWVWGCGAVCRGGTGVARWGGVGHGGGMVVDSGGGGGGGGGGEAGGEK
jgi:hypothetical protein